MAHPGDLPLTLYRGDSYTFDVVVTGSDGGPADLADVVAAAEVRKGAEVITLVCTVTEPNTVTVTLPAAAWGAMGAGVARWDLQLTFPDARVYTLLAGAVTIVADVTA